MKKKKNKKSRLFEKPPKYKKYAKIVKIGDAKEAKKSRDELIKEYKKAHRHAKKIRIKKAYIYEHNRIDAMLKNHHYSKEYRDKLKKAYKLYLEKKKQLK